MQLAPRWWLPPNGSCHLTRPPCAIPAPAPAQAQRDFFGSHTYERTDGKEGWFHTVWDPTFG